jgi:hypothetical protein
MSYENRFVIDAIDDLEGAWKAFLDDASPMELLNDVKNWACFLTSRRVHRGDWQQYERCLEALRAKCQSYLGCASIGHPDRAALFVKAIDLDEEDGEETCYFDWMDPEIDDAADADVLPYIHAARARTLVLYMFDEQALAYALAHGQDPRRILAGTGRTLLEWYEDCIDLGPGRTLHRAQPEDRELMQGSINALREAQVRLSVESLTL